MLNFPCENCPLAVSPYITAYEIAVKNGFQGTEADWVKTLQSVYVTKVKSKGAMDWSCTDKFADLVELSKTFEVHLLTPEGRTAFCNGLITDDTTDRIRFQTLSYYDEDVDGNVYEVYELYANENGTFLLADAYAPGLDSITKEMLSSQVTNELDGALQKSDQATRSEDQNHQVGVDPENGDLWVKMPTDYVKDSVQPSKTEAMTNQVGLDGQGQLWAEGYAKPPGGIPFSDLNAEVNQWLQSARTIYVSITKTGNVYDVDWENTDLHGYTNILAAIGAGVDVQMLLIDGYDYILHPLVKVESNGSGLIFSGPEYDDFGGTVTESIVYYIARSTQTHVTRDVVDL